MAITLTVEPPTTTDFDDPATPVPVSDCLRWCMQSDDADGITTGGTFAEMEVTFLTTIGSIPADGTQFTVWGHTFEVDSTIGSHTSTKFKIVSSGNTTGSNFRRMLKANVFFAQNATVVTNPDFFTARSTKITWNGCGQQENFTGAAMDILTVLAATLDGGAPNTVTNGTEPVYVPGYMLQFRLLKYDTASGAHVPVGKFRGIEPRFDCDAISEECVNLMRDAARLVNTPMPDLAIDSEIDPDDDTVTGRYVLNYGWTFRDAECQPQSGDFAETGDVVVVNAAFAVEDKTGIDKFWERPIPGDGILRQRFLTNQPTFSTLGENSFAWLWLLNSFTEPLALTGNGTGTPFTLDHFKLVVEIYENGSVIVDDSFTVDYPAALWYQVLNFNVSPGRVVDLGTTALADIGKYGIYVNAYNSGETEFMRLTEELVFGVLHECDTLTDMYFLSPPGGIVTIVGEVLERDLEQSGAEICLDTDCAETRQDLAKYGGRMLTNIRSFEKVTWRARKNYNAQEVECFRSFKASPERWIQVREMDGARQTTTAGISYIAKRLIVDTGGVKIFQTGDYVDLVVTGYMSDIPLQTPRNLS